jgi:hypothetical protein
MITFKNYIEEARRNPHQNPKISGYDFLYALHQKKRPFPTGVINHFVSFTKVDKLGINPGSMYDTPLGIYSYPVEYVLKEVPRSSGDMTKLPFAGDSPFLNSFSLRGNIIDLNKMTNSEAASYYNKIVDVLMKNADGILDWKKVADNVEKIINESSSKAKFGNIVGGRFWYVTMKVADKYYYVRGATASVAWNSLFRGIGIDGAYDMGTGIIHTSEKTQCVVFNPRAIIDVKRSDNKWSTDSIEKGTKIGNEMKDVLRLKNSLDPKDINRLIKLRGTLNQGYKVIPSFEQIVALLKTNNKIYADDLYLDPYNLLNSSLLEKILNSSAVPREMIVHIAKYV